jgi:hypothetical protein
MFTKTEGLYDALYAWKDYKAEATRAGDALYKFSEQRPTLEARRSCQIYSPSPPDQRRPYYGYT